MGAEMAISAAIRLQEFIEQSRVEDFDQVFAVEICLLNSILRYEHTGFKLFVFGGIPLFS
jgi:hypothetical protein